MASKRKAAGRCTECNRAMAVWQYAEGTVVPIGSVDGCPCGGSSFRVLTTSLE